MSAPSTNLQVWNRKSPQSPLPSAITSTPTDLTSLTDEQSAKETSIAISTLDKYETPVNGVARNHRCIIPSELSSSKGFLRKAREEFTNRGLTPPTSKRERRVERFRTRRLPYIGTVELSEASPSGRTQHGILTIADETVTLFYNAALELPTKPIPEAPSYETTMQVLADANFGDWAPKHHAHLPPFECPEKGTWWLKITFTNGTKPFRSSGAGGRPAGFDTVRGLFGFSTMDLNGTRGCPTQDGFSSP